jgi:CelD/BcsL family acetyltransferase involved in cellulose biosynthesis
LRRSERRLIREHRLEYRLTTDPERLEHDLQVLIDLHRRRWRDGRSDAFAGPRRAFHLEFAREALEKGWLRLWTMILDGRPAAAWYGLRFGGLDHYYQSGRDPRLAPLRVGFVLLAHTIRSACEDGMSEYRFGLGDEAYKCRFCDHDPGLETVAVATGLRGRLGLASLRAGLKARDLARGAPRVGAKSPGV